MNIRTSLIAFFLVILAASAIYLPMVGEQIGWYNSAEFTIAAITLDVPHAPGYPLYTRLGNLAVSLFPGANPAYCVNLLTAFIGILGAGLFTLMLCFYGLSWFSSVLGGFLLLTCKTYWEQSLLAEIYNLEICLIISGLLVGMALEKGRSCAITGFLAGMVGALGVGHRPTFILYALSLVFFIRASRGSFRPDLKFFTFMLAGMLVGLMPTCDLYLRLQNPHRVLLDPMIGQGFDGFLRVFSATVYRGGLFAFSLPEIVSRLIYFVWFAFADGGAWLLTGAVAFIFMPRQPVAKALPSALLTIFLVNLVFVINYNAFEAHTMLLPSLMALAAFAAMSVEKIRWHTLRNICCLALVSTCVYSSAARVEPPDNSPKDFVRQSITALPTGTLLMMSNDIEFRPYWFMRVVENFRRDISVQLVDRLETAELAALKPAIDNGKLYGSLIYPPDSRKKLVASYSIIPEGYLHKIVPAERFFEDAPSSASTKTAVEPHFYPGAKPVPGGYVKYSYSFSGSAEVFKKMLAVTVLVDEKGRTIERNGIMVGHDVHFPADYFCSNGNLKLNLLEVTRSLVIPTDLSPGNYRVMMMAAEAPAGLPPDWLDFLPREVNLFNLDGFLEVFTLKYGLVCRPLLKTLNLSDFLGEQSLRHLWKTPVELASFKIP
ncbi:MAG: DUF2723 domain-containing protein [Erysipelotrichia bacterium]|nr:DUF2723 domain-containing protein [Erysipelotrichia bacterium]